MRKVLILALLTLVAACADGGGHRVDLAPDFAAAVLLPGAPEVDLALSQDGPLITDGVAAGIGPRAGWGERTPAGRFALGPQSTLWAVLPDGRCDELELEARALPRPDGAVQRLTVVLNGADVGRMELPESWDVRRVALPEHAVRTGFNEIGLRWDPVAEGGSGAVAIVRRVRLGTAAESAGSPQVTVEGGMVRFDGPAVLLLPLRLPAGRSTLDLGGRLRGGRRAEAVVSLMQLDGTRVQLDRTRGRGRIGRVALDVESRGWRFLHLELRDGSLELERPALVLPQPPAPPVRTAAVPESPARNLVVVVLDAARADHFSCYGYERPTTPNLDALAAEGHAFGNAVAEAAYTMASVPTLLSGRAVLRHGVHAAQHRLGDGVPTAAELLRVRGWTTVGLSATPNFSRETGGDRGFDEFVETWRHGDFWHSRDPYVLTERALARLERGFEGRPFLLWLHYVPPHEPYLPAPEHDVFGDPGYDGPVDSSFEVLQALREGRLEPTPADVAELVALYDGTLRTADDAVGRLLAALRERPDWDETAVLVLADHGEAFYEHGAQGHNSTLYEETVRVPFILRAPDGVPAASDRGRLVTVADAVPTLLGLVGLPVPVEVDGRDLLASAPEAPRWAVLRTSGERPHYAVRTAGFKLIVRGGRPRELYELGRDPAEQVNLVTHRPVLAVALTALLERELVQRPEAVGEAAPPGAESEAVLRSLGYL